MVDLKTRSHLLELLDADNIPFDDIRQNMQELNKVNSLLGGHAITIAGIKQLLLSIKPNGPLVICEIGCGGGDNLLAIANWCSRKNISVQFIGIDIKPACIAYAQQQCRGLNASWITSDYRQADLTNKPPAIIFSSLFCHHFNDAALSEMLQWMKHHSTAGFFINDLHRHWLAYYSIKMLTRLFSKSYLVKNDAPLSVARGFRRDEWQLLLQQAGCSDCAIKWRWAFRHLIVYRHA